MPFAELGPFSQSKAKLLALLNRGFTVLLYASTRSKSPGLNTKNPAHGAGFFCIGSLNALRRARAVQPEDCKIVCSPKSRLHCTTL